VYAVQAALAQEVTGQHPTVIINAWTPSMTVHPHLKHVVLGVQRLPQVIPSESVYDNRRWWTICWCWSAERSV